MGTKEIRFAVGRADDVRSSVWRLWGQKDDVYLGARTFLGVMKISLHQSGIGRVAIISKTPRPALARWKRPNQLAPGFTRLFMVMVPPYLVTGPFHQDFTEKKTVHFVPPPRDDQHKVIFCIAVSAPHFTAEDLLDLPRDRPITIIGRLPLKTGVLWLYQYYDGFRFKERKLIQEYVWGVKLHPFPAKAIRKSAQIHWFDTHNVQPHVVDIRLGTGNETHAQA